MIQTEMEVFFQTQMLYNKKIGTKQHVLKFTLQAEVKRKSDFFALTVINILTFDKFECARDFLVWSDTPYVGVTLQTTDDVRNCFTHLVTMSKHT